MPTPGADALARFRRNNKNSQLEIAHAIGTYPQYVGQWERGERTPTLWLAIKLEKLTKGKVPCMSWELACELQVA